MLAGCGGADELAPWIALEAFDPATSIDAAAWEKALGTRILQDRDGIWLVWSIGPEPWEKPAESDVFRCPRPLHPRVSDPNARSLLESGGIELTMVLERDPEALQPGEYALRQGKLFVNLPPGQSSTGSLRFSEFVSRGERSAKAWEVFVGRVSGRGLPVWPGESWRVATPIPERSALRFFVTAKGDDTSDGEGVATLVFRIRLDGEILWELERRAGNASDGWQEIRLPEGGSNLSLFEFQVEGPPGLSAFVDPVIGPANPDPQPDRPNIVLFVADTFRADNMQAYGGDPETTPFLNALARESLVFERAWGTSSWTLPSQSSLFTGLLPPQHGATLDTRVLPEALTTITEVLSRNGYRTAAITDASFLSPRFQLDQGFDWFQVHPGPEGWSLATTLRRSLEFQEAFDGRPTFLFVHTYRAHEPYRVGPEESREETKELLRELLHSLRAEGDFDEQERLDVASRYSEFYRRGVQDLDQQFGDWWRRVQELPAWGTAHLAFTSDHGEAFYEHRSMGHRGKLWEETLRIPMFLHGPGITAERRGFAASVIDLPRTIAGLAGVAADDDWLGCDLRGLQEERPVYGFWETTKIHEAFIVHADRKICVEANPEALQQGKLQRSFELGQDPGEQHDVSSSADWPAQMARDHAREMRTFLRSLAPTQNLLDAEREGVLEELRAIGYGGD